KTAGREQQKTVRRKNREAALGGARFCGKFADASGRIRGARRLLHRRRLPQSCPEMGAAHGGSNATKVEGACSLDSEGIWKRESFRRRKRADSFWRHREARGEQQRYERTGTSGGSDQGSSAAATCEIQECKSNAQESCKACCGSREIVGQKGGAGTTGSKARRSLAGAG